MRRFGGLFSLLITGFLIPNPVFADEVPNNVQVLVKQIIENDLRDPESSKYDWLIYKHKAQDKSWIVCGTINTKNGFGGYTGKKPFSVFYNDKSKEFSKIYDNDDLDGIRVAVCKGAPVGSDWLQ